MPANVNPIFSLTPNVGRAVVGATALAKSDGTATAIGTDMMLVCTAGANGSWVSKVRFTPVATAAATALSATTLRIYVLSVGTGATTGGTNAWNIGEVSAAAQTADQTTTAIAPLEFPLNFALQSGLFIACSSHIINVANTSWQAVCFAGDY